MVETAKIVDLLTGFGATYGIPAEAFGPLGECSLGFDGMVLELEFHVESQQIILEAEVGPLPRPDTVDLGLKLLELNLLAARSGAGQVAIDHEAGKVIYCARRAAEGLTQVELERFVEDSLTAVSVWKDWLAQPGPSSAEPALGDAASGDHMVFRI